jgi:hypothetical protein
VSSRWGLSLREIVLITIAVAVTWWITLEEASLQGPAADAGIIAGQAVGLAHGCYRSTIGDSVACRTVVDQATTAAKEAEAAYNRLVPGMVQAAAQSAIGDAKIIVTSSKNGEQIVTSKSGKQIDLACFFTDPALRPATCPPQSVPARDVASNGGEQIVTSKSGKQIDLACFFTDPTMRPAKCPPQSVPARDDEWHVTPNGMRWRLLSDQP